MCFLEKINTFTSEGERPHPDESLEKYGTSCFESLDPDAIILFSDVDEIVFSQHLLILKNVDFPINTFCLCPTITFTGMLSAVSSATPKFSFAPTWTHTMATTYFSTLTRIGTCPIPAITVRIAFPCQWMI